MNSVLVYVLTKGQGGGILPMEDTNPQELEEIENVTSGERFLRFSGRGCDLASEIVKNRRNHAGNRHFYT